MTDRGHGQIDYFAPAWDDIRIVPGAFQFAGLSDPTLADWQPGGAGAIFKLYEFASGDEAFYTIQLPHTYKRGTNVKAHIHWTPGARGTAESGKSVFWKTDVSAASIDLVFPSSTTLNLTDICSGVNDEHEKTSEVDLDGTLLAFSSIIVGRIYRDSGDTWSLNTPGNLPRLLEIDFHFQMNSTGSEGFNNKIG